MAGVGTAAATLVVGAIKMELEVVGVAGAGGATKTDEKVVAGTAIGVVEVGSTMATGVVDVGSTMTVGVEEVVGATAMGVLVEETMMKTPGESEADEAAIGVVPTAVVVGALGSMVMVVVIATVSVTTSYSVSQTETTFLFSWWCLAWLWLCCARTTERKPEMAVMLEVFILRM